MSVIDFPRTARNVPLTPDEEWEQIERLNQEVQDLLRQVGRYGRKEERAQNFLRYRFNVACHKDLTLGQMKQAIPLLKVTVAQCQEFSRRMHEISDAFDTEVVGHGVPWTPWIVRKMGRRRMHAEGDKPDWKALYEELRAELPDS